MTGDSEDLKLQRKKTSEPLFQHAVTKYFDKRDSNQDESHPDAHHKHRLSDAVAGHGLRRVQKLHVMRNLSKLLEGETSSEEDQNEGNLSDDNTSNTVNSQSINRRDTFDFSRNSQAK